MGERVTTMFSKTNPETSPLFTIRREVLIMGSIRNWLIEGVQDDDADIRSDTIQYLKRNLATKGCCGDVVKDITHILEGEQPAMGRRTCPIHDGIGPGLDGSILPFSWVLVLVVGLRLPIIDVIGPEDVLDLTEFQPQRALSDPNPNGCEISQRILIQPKMGVEWNSGSLS